jgi:putative heme-binding domain-containing protein
VFTHSRVGKPGTPDAERTPLNAAIWRYHPTRHEFEVFAEGTSNPWGVDFDDHGQAFCTACVIPHLYHVIEGARYQRQAGSHFNPHTYADIQTIADHRHYLGDNPHGGNGRSDDAGGGHAHAGAMIYLGGAWPEEYRGRVFMNNIHGQRLNTDILKPEGSGFVGGHGPDFLLTGDIASQILNIRYGPDGNAYFIDWYDTNACHHNNAEGHDRSNGRVYKICYGDPKPAKVDLAKASDLELAELTLEKNDWYVRHARRLMQERAAAGKQLEAAARERLIEIATSNPDETRRLRAIWALNAVGDVGAVIRSMFADSNEHVRAWAVRLIPELRGAAAAQWQMAVAGASGDPSPVVRLAVASLLQKLPADERWSYLEGVGVEAFPNGLLTHAEDADDHNLPLMYWYAAEPLAARDPARALKLAESCRETIPLVSEFLVRRLGSLEGSKGLVALARGVAQADDAAWQLQILRGMRKGLEGRRRVEPPANWADAAKRALASENDDVRSEAIALGVTFGDAAALDILRKRVDSPTGDEATRRQAVEALLAVKDPQLASVLVKLLRDAPLRDLALKGLAAFDEPRAPAAVLELYPELTPEEKRLALATLCSRGGYGVELLKAIAAKRVAAADLSADLVRQLHQLKHDEVSQLLEQIWGRVRNTPEDKARMIADYRKLLEHPKSTPDIELGRSVFARTCQQCHTLYGTGGQVGPDLTGSNRADLGYLLSNIIDPSAVIAKEYFTTIVYTLDGRVVSGIVVADNDKAVTLQTATERVVIPYDEVDERKQNELSMMPDDQLKQFSETEIAALFAYLGGKSQVSMLAQKENQAQLFNGKNLDGWKGEMKYWSVENGEIIGRSPGIEENTFLVSDLTAGDFKLSLEVKLVDNVGNSGVQFRTEPIENGQMRGYQADIGEGWWGKLYEEHGRALLWDKPADEHLKKGQWNRYEIEAKGSRIRTWLNGKLCVDLDDPEGKRRGIFALQLHSGGPMEVRFRKLKLEVLDEKAL